MALYTETFEKFLEEHEQGSIWQGIRNLFDAFPDYTIEELNYNVYDLVKERYLLREIGAEDEAIFTTNFKMVTNRVIIDYVPKIKALISSYENLSKHTIKTSSKAENDDYLYPLTSANKRIGSSQEIINDNESILAGDMTNADFLENLYSLKNIYIETVDAFDKCFMGVY